MTHRKAVQRDGSRVTTILSNEELRQVDRLAAEAGISREEELRWMLVYQLTLAETTSTVH